MNYPNPEQHAVLSHLNGTLLVLAPAGTGKTRLMADRLSKVISSGMPPEHTLGVTFTNRAAEHMRTAVKDACGADAKACRIQTFHGLCAWILRTEARDAGLPADFVIYDEQDSIDLLRQCIKESGISPDAAFWQLSQIKSDCPVTSLSLAEIPPLDMTGLSPTHFALVSTPITSTWRNATLWTSRICSIAPERCLLPATPNGKNAPVVSSGFKWMRCRTLTTPNTKSSAFSRHAPRDSPSSAISTRQSTSGAARSPTKS